MRRSIEARLLLSNGKFFMGGTHELNSPQVRNSAETLVAELVGEMNAYRKETRLYPPEHPRLRGRVAALETQVRRALSGKERLAITVDEKGLRTGGSGIVDGAHLVDGPGAQLHDVLRERMVRTLVFDSGVNRDDLETLMEFLTCPVERSLIENSRLEHMESIEVERFSAFFDGESSTTSDLLNTLSSTQIGYGSFSQSELEMISQVMGLESVKVRLERIRGLLGVGGKGVDYLASFFSLLRDDPSTNWELEEPLRRSLITGLDLLEDAHRKQRVNGALPTDLVAPTQGTTEHLSTAFRWRLLRSFFPGASKHGNAPRDAEDLSFGAVPELSSDQWRVGQFPDGCRWGETPVQDSVRPVAEQFASEVLIPEFLEVGAYLLAEGPDPDTRSRLAETISAQLVGNESGAIEALDHMIDRPAWAVVFGDSGIPVEVLRALAPDPLFELLRRLYPRAAARHFVPPPSLDTPITGTSCSDRVREVVRQLVSPRDRRALEIALYGYRRFGDPDDPDDPWILAARESNEPGQLNDAWVEFHAEVLFDFRSVPILVELPYQEIMSGLRWRLVNDDGSDSMRLIAALGRSPGRHSVHCLNLALEIGTPALRGAAIQSLGQLQSAQALLVLEGLLQQQNIAPSDDGEVGLIVQSLAAHEGPEGGEFLDRVVDEKLGLLKKAWRREIRRLARQARKKRS